jgi:hypothetical protein
MTTTTTTTSTNTNTNTNTNTTTTTIIIRPLPRPLQNAQEGKAAFDWAKKYESETGVTLLEQGRSLFHTTIWLNFMDANIHTH